MGERLYMAVDLGTSFIKAGVYTIASECLARWSEPVRDERPEPGVFIQRGEDLFQSVLRCLRGAARGLGDRAKDVAAIAFTGQMAGSMGVDENWEDVTTWSCSLDSRYLPYAERQRALYADDLFEIGGTNAPVMCAKYAWFREEFPEEHARIAKYVMLNGYIIGRLSKISVHEAKIDNSLITWTGMADVRRRAWSEKLCDEMGIDRKLLPEIADCTAVGGYLDVELARELGLRSGIPLVMGAGDKVSGCAGAGILETGDMIFEAGSYGAISCLVQDVRLDSAKRNYDVIGSVDCESYYLHKYIQGSGIAIDWFMEEFMRGEGMDKGRAMQLAEEAALRVRPGSERMMAIGLLSGSAMPFDSEMKGMFLGHSLNHGRGHFYRALLESFAYDLALTLDSMCALYPQFTGREIKLIGGGARSAVWPQILADVTGHPFARLDREDAALWGAAMLAAAGTGDIADIRETARAHVRSERIYAPNGENHALYRPYKALYARCTGELHDLYRELNAL